MENEDIRRYSLEEIRAMVDRGDYSQTRNDAPIYELDEEFWKNARVVLPERFTKTHMGIRVDKDVLSWFKGQGRGW